MAGQEIRRHYRTPDAPDGEFTGAVADPAVVAEAWAVWRAEVAFAERLVAEAPDLDVEGAVDGERMALREVLVHMIEEYARHNGHADFPAGADRRARGPVARHRWRLPRPGAGA
ncbi:hypothetical protein GCM10020254_57730 [Streptomyces goshikiensis]